MADDRHWILKTIENHGDKKALAYNHDVYSFNQINLQVDTYRSLLKGKIKHGEVVAIYSDYNFHAIALFLALLDHRCIIVPITSTLQAEVDERISEGFVESVISLTGKNFFQIEKVTISNDKHDLIKRLIDNDHSGLILFSSGSTGKPKAMIHDLDNLCNSYKDKKNKNISMMIFLMFDHIGGLNTLLNALSMGALMVIPANRDVNHVAQLIQDHKVRILPTSPTFLNMLLMSDAPRKYNLTSLRMITYGTETMPDSLLTRLKEFFPRTKFLQTFGTSETGIAQTVSRSSESTFMKFEDTNLEHKIVGKELWLRSKTQITGYLNASMESFTDDGWFKTGDLVEKADGGFIKIVGRTKEMINVGGEKVLPSEVESVLLQSDDIIDCTVYGEKNTITGQNVAVNVVLREKLSDRETKKMVRKWCKGKIEPYKIPTTVSVVKNTDSTARFKKVRNL